MFVNDVYINFIDFLWANPNFHEHVLKFWIFCDFKPIPAVPGDPRIPVIRRTPRLSQRSARDLQT